MSAVTSLLQRGFMGKRRKDPEPSLWAFDAMALRNAAKEVAVMRDYMQLVPRWYEAAETAALLVEQLENLAEMEAALADEKPSLRLSRPGKS